MNFLDKWNKSKFNVYDSEEKTVLKLLTKIGDFIGELSKGVDDKTDLIGDHKGSWQGINKPTLSDEGMRGTVEKHISEINNINTELNNVNAKFKNSSFRSPEDYGCKGDGLTDDSTNFLNAMTDCANNGYVLSLKGKYKIGTPINYDGVTSLTIIGSKGNYNSLMSENITSDHSNILFTDGATLTLSKLGCVTFLGVGFSSTSKETGTGLIIQSFHNKFIACSFTQFNKAIYNKVGYINWNGENQYLYNIFNKCEYAMYNDDLSNSDSEFIGNLIGGHCSYGLWGEFAGWKIAHNHFYNRKASYIKIFNTDITNNYIQECTQENVTLKVGDGFGCNIIGNKFELNNDTARTEVTGLIGLMLSNGRGNITITSNAVHGKSNTIVDNLCFIKLIYTTKFDNILYIGGNSLRVCKSLFNEHYPYYNINGQLSATNIPIATSSGTVDIASYCKVINGVLSSYTKITGVLNNSNVLRISAIDTPYIAHCNVTTSSGTTLRQVYVSVGGWVVLTDYATISSVEIIVNTPLSHGSLPKYTLS